MMASSHCFSFGPNQASLNLQGSRKILLLADMKACVSKISRFSVNPGVKQSCQSRRNPVLTVCQANRKDLSNAREAQLQSTELLAVLLKSEDPRSTAREHLQSMNDEFFMIASTYLSMAKKEGNAGVVSQLESTLKIAMEEKEKSLRPEIRLLNQLLRDTSSSARSKTMSENEEYLKADSYFHQLVNMMTMDVEKQPNSAHKLRLLNQLHSIQKEAREVSKKLKHKER